MSEVLTNLLSNAAKFTAEGGEFGLHVVATDREVRLEGWDHGIGIEPADVAKLFRLFVQLDGHLAGATVATASVWRCVVILARARGNTQSGD